MQRTKRGMALVCVTVLFFGMSAAIAADITISTLVKEGDSVPGVGLFTRPDNLAINNFGQWYVEGDTDNSDTNVDGAIITGFLASPFTVAYREGQALTSPAGALLDSFDAVNLNDAGNSGWNFFLDGTSGSNDDSGIYFNADLVIQEGTISTAPEFTPGTPYIGFFEAKINNSDQILVVASVDDPNIDSSVDRGLVRIDNPGGAYTETVLYKEGDELVAGAPVNDFGTGPHYFAFNDAGQLLFYADIGDDSSTDGSIWLDDTLLAREGSPSPLAGANYDFLSSRGMDMNNNGDYVFKASTNAATGDDLLVKNGAVFMREGESLPAIGGTFVFTTFGTGSGPVQIDDAGNVVWFGDWDDPDTDVDTGLFWNDQLIVQEGVTEIDGVIIDTISSGQDAFQLSKNGSYLIFEGVGNDGLDAVFLVTISDEAPVGDIDGDGDVDFDDLNLLLASYGKCEGDAGYNPDANLNDDLCVDFDDLNLLLASYGFGT